jgi:hypothetical protein
VQLVYQDWRTEWFPGLAQEMLTKFNSEHPSIRVFYTPDPDNLEVKMPADMAAGTAPDVLAGCCEFFPAWANAGYLLDLRPYVEADLDQETIKIGRRRNTAFCRMENSCTTQISRRLSSLHKDFLMLLG